MIVIVEGIDRVGKTTLCNKLCSMYPSFSVYKHDCSVMSYKDMDNVNEADKQLQLLDMYGLLGGDIIFDRFNMSDTVYGVMNRRPGYIYDILSNNTYYHFNLIDKKLHELGAFIVMVEPVDINESSKQHGIDLSEHHDLFNVLFDASTCDKVKVDYNVIRGL
jgi:hypothetical protein